MSIIPKYDDGTPKYNKIVRENYRKLQFRSCTYEQPPKTGKGIRLGVYQAQAACGEEASERNVERLIQATEIAADRGVQLLSFPELYIQGYTQSPESAKQVAESVDGPSLTRCRQAAKNYDLKDRRPDMYKMLVEKEVGFQPGGYCYPDYVEGREVK